MSPNRREALTDDFSGDFEVVLTFDPAQEKLLAHVTQGSAPHGELRSFNQHPIEGVTIELVEQELLEMVRYGLDRAIRQVDTWHTMAPHALS